MKNIEEALSYLISIVEYYNTDKFVITNRPTSIRIDYGSEDSEAVKHIYNKAEQYIKDNQQRFEAKQKEIFDRTVRSYLGLPYKGDSWGSNTNEP